MISKKYILSLNPNLKPSYVKFLYLTFKHVQYSKEYLQEYINYSFDDILDNNFLLTDYLIELNDIVNPNKRLTTKSINLLTSIICRYQWDAEGELKTFMELESHKIINRETRCRLRKLNLSLNSKEKLKIEYLIKEILELGGIYGKNKITINNIWKGILLDEELCPIQKII